MSVANVLSGFLGTEPVMLIGGAPYTENVGSLSGSGSTHNGNQGGNHNNDDTINMLRITGNQWIGRDIQGLMVTNGVIELRKEVFRIYVTPSAASINAHYNMLKPANNEFATSNNAPNGAYLSLRDGNGILWTTEGDQTGSNFRVITRGVSQLPATTITGVTSCKMYDGFGNMKTFNSDTFTIEMGL